MKDHARLIIAIATGVAIHLLLLWLTSGKVAALGPFLFNHKSLATALVYLAPWIITGMVSDRRQILAGAVSAVIALSISRSFVIFMPWPVLLTTIASSALYGAAGAALGSVVRSSNNSFKPNPLRGSA